MFYVYYFSIEHNIEYIYSNICNGNIAVTMTQTIIIGNIICDFMEIMDFV